MCDLRVIRDSANRYARGRPSAEAFEKLRAVGTFLSREEKILAMHFFRRTFSRTHLKGEDPPPPSARNRRALTDKSPFPTDALETLSCLRLVLEIVFGVNHRPRGPECVHKHSGRSNLIFSLETSIYNGSRSTRSGAKCAANDGDLGLRKAGNTHVKRNTENYVRHDRNVET